MPRKLDLDTFFGIVTPFLKGEADQRATAREMFGSDDDSTAEARGLSIYRDVNMGVALQAVFPRVHGVVTACFGSDRWDTLVRNYFAMHPPRHYELNMNGIHFPEFLMEERGRNGVPLWIAELADLEWWEWQTLVARDDPRDALSGTGRLRLASTVELRPYEHDFTAWCRSADPHTRPISRRTLVLFWRDADLTAWRRDADALEVELLRLVHRNEDITPFTWRHAGEPWAIAERVEELIREGILVGALPERSCRNIGAVRLSTEELETAARTTLNSYGRSAEEFFETSLKHDVAENRESFLRSIVAAPPHDLLDLGCGSGRDLQSFRLDGHRAIGLDGVREMVDIARRHSGCEVLHQDLLDMTLAESAFDGIFANASLFHVPSQELPRILQQLRRALKPQGVLFTSNPLGDDEEGWVGDRYAVFYAPGTWAEALHAAGFDEIFHYYRPRGPEVRPLWLASVWRRKDAV